LSGTDYFTDGSIRFPEKKSLDTKSSEGVSSEQKTNESPAQSNEPVAVQLAQLSSKYRALLMELLFETITPLTQGVADQGHNRIRCLIVDQSNTNLTKLVLNCLRQEQDKVNSGRLAFSVCHTVPYNSSTADMAFIFTDPTYFQQYFIDRRLQPQANLIRVSAASKFVLMVMDLTLSWSDKEDFVPTLKPATVHEYNLVATLKEEIGAAQEVCSET
jgi:hypothetical protein